MAATIRPYRAGDRDAVRHICYVTGYMGEPAGWYWRDELSFADIWTSYYTDREPESLFVAELDGTVVGYISGCVDSRRAWNPAIIGARHAIMRLCLLRPGTAPFLWQTMADVVVGKFRGELPITDTFSDGRWPAHLHINILPKGRRSGAGRGLMNAWLERLRSLGSPGCHIETLAENERAIAFFEATGFTRHGDPEVVPGERTREGGRVHRQIMVQSLG